MVKVELKHLRALRMQASELALTLCDDLRSFLHQDQLTFRRLPEDPKDGNVSVATTCSCLMALALSNRLMEFHGKDFAKNAKEAFIRIVEAEWTSGLTPDNGFTTVFVLRTLGMLTEAEALNKDATARRRTYNGRRLSLAEIATEIACDPNQNFAILQYPPTPAVTYWFIDGIDRTAIELPESSWGKLYEWAGKEFSRQRSLVLASHDALMDPVALGMAACLCARLRKIAKTEKLGTSTKYLERHPSLPELNHSIVVLFSKQAESGIWPKYFPLFHYPKAGSNFCFTFELLEAVLKEFGDSEVGLIGEETVFRGLEKAVKWCREYRLPYSQQRDEYNGWNSGGDLSTLTRGQPESWATAVVHMFLWQLQEVLSGMIQDMVLENYRARQPKSKSSGLDGLVDIGLLLKDQKARLKETLKKELVEGKQRKTAAEVRKRELTGAVSALLFGPPGTSKTTVCEALADDLGWQLIQIDPSHFLRLNLEGIYTQADRIFEDLMDLSAVVVLFDEMDAFFQTRNEPSFRLDITSQFLTTWMLPRLAKLRKENRVIFLMATNHQEKFDPAIKRAGRFDLLLCMGPPTLDKKLENLHVFLGLKQEETTEAKSLLDTYTKGSLDLIKRLTFYTFDEFKRFMKELNKGQGLLEELKSIGQEGFAKEVQAYSKFVILRLEDLTPLEEKLDRPISTMSLDDLDQIPIDNLTELDEKARSHPIVRYLLDRHESKLQG